MSEHAATIRWECAGGEFLAGKFSRDHTWSFDGGATVRASASPAIVPQPLASPECVDPEEALVATIASCHMLTFLYFAYKQGFQVNSYEDQAVGLMTKNDRGVPWIGRVTLRPKVTYGGDRRPTAEEEARLHHSAHDKCFIANSVKTEVSVEPVG